MKLRWKILAGLAVVAACALMLFRPDHRERDALEQTRREIRAQGFKTDLADFNFSIPPEVRARAAALTNTDPRSSNLKSPGESFYFFLAQNGPNLMKEVGSNAALVVWREAKLSEVAPPGLARLREADNSEEDLWPALRDAGKARETALDAACAAAISGPIRFELDAGRGRSMLLPHLAIIKNLSQALGTQVVLDLHDQKPEAAWTNLLAATRLVTGWDPEPPEISHLLRAALMSLAFNTTWQALQYPGWSDEQLAALQREWETVDFFHGLPETEAFARASDADACQRERQQPLSFGMPLAYVQRHPGFAWNALVSYLQRVRYRQHGSYEDEQAFLLYHRDREIELRKAIQAPSWIEMRALPGVTNQPAFQSKHASGAQSLFNLARLGSRFPGAGQGFLGRIAEAEARRRLCVAAIALERYRLRHGAYPKTLAEVAPEFLRNPPADFMDGQPLRYGLTDDGHFVLYSVGLDCVDDGGKMQAQVSPVHSPMSPAVTSPVRRFASARFGIRQDSDLVWPRPATPAEARAQAEEENKALEEQRKQWLLNQLADEEKEEENRQATVQNLLNIKQPPRATEPTFEGRPLSALLSNKIGAGKTAVTIDELLTLRQIITGQEPEIATFEAPVNYSAATNIGSLELLVDEDPADLSKSDGGELEGCRPAANGNCLLVWNTGTDAPGEHAIQAQFSYVDGKKWNRRRLEIKGPPAAYYSSNLCQFVAERCSLSPLGAVLYAKLSESNGVYDVELKSPSGAHLKTISGTTSNGVIEVRWDLIDDGGQTYTNSYLDSVFHVTLPGSGRSMTQRGP